MELFNSTIKKAEALLSASALTKYDFNASACWPETTDFELVMQRDSAFELGGSNYSAVNFSCVTSDPDLVSRDEILVYGPELSSLRSDSPYARLVFLNVRDIDAKDNDTESTFRAIQNIDFVKYHVFPKGYMIRTSSESNREQVRISKEAVKSGISFRSIGNSFIKHYKEDPHVVAAKIIFITDPKVDFKALIEYAKNVHDITMTLSKILEGMPTDCKSCNLKPICDEVEGMKELHFGKKK